MPIPIHSGSVIFHAVDSSNNLGERLYLQMHQKEGNFVYSPYTISTLLAISYFSASNETKRALEKNLQFSDNQNITLTQFARLLKQIKDPRISTSSSIWLQSNAIKNKTEEVVNRFFGPIFHNVDFNKNLRAIAEEINKLSSAATGGKLTQFIQESNLSPDLKMLLTDLFFLKAAWRTPFPQENTKEEIFQMDAIKSKNVKMMHVSSEFAYSSSDRFFLIEVPLAIPKGIRKEISFYLLLPKIPEWMLTIEEEFNVKTILQAARGVQKTMMELSIPLFDISELISLKEPLEQIGLNDLFLNAANFTKILPKGGISKFFHVSPLNVTESGIEANELSTKALPIKKKSKDTIQFIFNRPFLFFAIDKGTGAILLMGRISEP